MFLSVSTTSELDPSNNLLKIGSELWLSSKCFSTSNAVPSYKPYVEFKDALVKSIVPTDSSNPIWRAKTLTSESMFGFGVNHKVPILPMVFASNSPRVSKDSLVFTNPYSVT